MIRSEEVLLYIPYAPKSAGESVARYITNLYKNKYRYISEPDYVVEVARILERVGANYNPELGHLVRYTKNTLALKLRDYASRKHKTTSAFKDDSAHSKLENMDVELLDVDMSEYSDAVVCAVYRTVKGMATKRDASIIRATFSIKDEDKGEDNCDGPTES
jgi:hypothetical protein